MPLIPAADWISATSAVAAVAGATFAWRAWRVSRQSYLVSIPYVVAERWDPLRPGFLDIHLAGAGAGLWEIDWLKLMKPKAAQFCEASLVEDGVGGVNLLRGPTIGRAIAPPTHRIIVSEQDGTVHLKVRLKLKADPRVRSTRTVAANA